MNQIPSAQTKYTSSTEYGLLYSKLCSHLQRLLYYIVRCQLFNTRYKGTRIAIQRSNQIQIDLHWMHLPLQI